MLGRPSLRAHPRSARFTSAGIARGLLRLLSTVALLAWLPCPPALAVVAIDWLEVGSAGNACDPQPQGCFGAVPYPFRIAKHTITNAQYAELLNAVASTADPLPPGPDPNGLYHEDMDASPHGGIVRGGDGILEDHVYTVKPGFASRPVNFVSFYDAARFANWIENGQPSGVQDATTTEDGAYPFSGAESVGPRNGGAQIHLPSEDEWYKAAYYDPSDADYFDFPTGTDTQTVCATPSAVPNTANCESAASGLTDVGAYPGSPAPSGAFDLGGGVWEWQDTDLGGLRTARGGSWLNDKLALAAEIRAAGSPNGEFSNQGIRLAPEAPQAAAFGAALLMLVGLDRHRRRTTPRTTLDQKKGT